MQHNFMQVLSFHRGAAVFSTLLGYCTLSLCDVSDILGQFAGPIGSST